MCGDGFVSKAQEEVLWGNRLLGPARTDVLVGVHDKDGCFLCVAEEGGGRESAQCCGAGVPPSCIDAHNLLSNLFVVWVGHRDGGAGTSVLPTGTTLATQAVSPAAVGPPPLQHWPSSTPDLFSYHSLDVRRL